MNIQESLAIVLTAPSPIALWQLRGDLYEVEFPVRSRAWEILDHFYVFLTELSAKSTAKEYSHFASLLDIGAVGGVAVQNLLDKPEKAVSWERLLMGGISESLMVLAARQYVKAWDKEMTAVYQNAAWYLYQKLWELSEDQQPDLENDLRRRTIEVLLAPIHQEKTAGTAKAALIGRLFQILLLAHMQISLNKLRGKD